MNLPSLHISRLTYDDCLLLRPVILITEIFVVHSDSKSCCIRTFILGVGSCVCGFILWSLCNNISAGCYSESQKQTGSYYVSPLSLFSKSDHLCCVSVFPRISSTSENGRGTLTIRDVKEADQGAYTCEAINAKGLVFGIPDGVLTLTSNPNQGTDTSPLLWVHRQKHYSFHYKLILVTIRIRAVNQFKYLFAINRLSIHS